MEHEDEHGTEKSDKEEEKTTKIPEAFRKQIDGILTVYFSIQEALSQDKPENVMNQGIKLKEALKQVNMGQLSGEAHMAWMKELEGLNKQTKVLESNHDIKRQREAFHLLSESLITAVKRFGTGGDHFVVQFHCPMAFDGKGADWLQDQEDIQNPYFGAKMLKCGEQTAILANLSD